MAKKTTEELIAEYEVALEAVEAIESKRRAEIQKLTPDLPPDIQMMIDRTNVGYDQEVAPLKEILSKAEAAAKKAVMNGEESVKGTTKHFIFSLRTSWDSKGLEGYAIADPNVLKFQKKTPSVSIRTIKKKEE